MEKIKRREWRGLHDTWTDFFGWLLCWGRILAFLPKAPPHTAVSFLRFPCYIDSQLTGLRSLPFRRSRLCCNAALKRCLSAFRSGSLLILDPSVPPELMAGFPTLTGVSTHGSGVSCALPLSADALRDCIRRMEAKTGLKFDWDAFFSYFSRFSSFSPYIDETCAERLHRLNRRSAAPALCRRALLLHCPAELRVGLCAWLEQSCGIVCVDPAIDRRSPKAALESIVRRYEREAVPALAADCGAELVISFQNEIVGGTPLLRLYGRTLQELRRELNEYNLRKIAAANDDPVLQ